MSLIGRLAMVLPLAPLALLLAGCPSPQTPYSFVAAGDMATSTDAAARTLAADGREVGTVDRQTGIVTSKWTMVGQPTANGVFVSRFTVIVAPAASGTNITVRMDVQSCPAGAYSVGDVEVKPTCRPIDGVFPGDQAKIDALGAKLKAAVEPKPG